MKQNYDLHAKRQGIEAETRAHHAAFESAPGVAARPSRRVGTRVRCGLAAWPKVLTLSLVPPRARNAKNRAHGPNREGKLRKMLVGGGPDDALEALGRVLEARGHIYEIVVVGGSALLLLGLISRPTKDLDVLALVKKGTLVTAKPLPAEIADAVADVAVELGLASDWLNAEFSAQLRDGLPEGFEQRLETRTYRSLTVHIASRVDQIHLKLIAVVDKPYLGKHADDLRRLEPTRDELIAAGRWACTQDILPEFPKLVAEVLRSFGVDDAEEYL